MSSTQNVNYFKEKVILREEEKSLKEMLGKFQDQLNRLKIEELALLSHIKLQEERQTQEVTDPKVQMFIRKARADTHSETGSSVSSAVPVGVMYYKTQSKEVAIDEDLDLSVKASMSARESLRHGRGFADEEEEEEEEEEEVVDKGRQNQDKSKNHLYSYMDTL
ncbi:hypothetical protein PoB_004730600 [Plakobranchus ocellatus]|uniref:Uncharacterized protein n=1 Tax=Plakobranchus ocellatus TaxID=259542 RepID=A0AAV4BBS3_9GAST|nr:hypothetical protein PoB_004730600 [Plakobranchus ocellatus]